MPHVEHDVIIVAYKDKLQTIRSILSEETVPVRRVKKTGL
jgi:hypothetical protein